MDIYSGRTVSDVCRICLEHSISYVKLFTKSIDRNKTNAEILEFVTKLKVSKNSVPSHICIECLAHLSFSYKFIQKCIKSNRAILPLPPAKQHNQLPVRHNHNPIPSSSQLVIPRISTICDPESAASIHFKNRSVMKQTPVERKSESSSSPEVLINASDCEVNIHETVPEVRQPNTTVQKVKEEKPSVSLSLIKLDPAKKPSNSFCRYCKKAFQYTESRNRHEREAHITNKTYTCEICGKIFKRNYVYKHHLASHKKKSVSFSTVADEIIDTKPNHSTDDFKWFLENLGMKTDPDGPQQSVTDTITNNC